MRHLPKKNKTNTPEPREAPKTDYKCIPSISLPDEITLEDGTVMTCHEIVSLKHKVFFSKKNTIEDLLLIEEIKAIVSELNPTDDNIKESTENVHKQCQTNVCSSRRRR